MKMKMMIMIMTMMNDDAFKECLWPRSSVDHSVNLPQYPTTWTGQWATSHFFFAVYSFPDVRCTANNRYILSQKWHSCDSYVTVARKGNQGVGLDVVQNGEDMMMTVSSWLYVVIMMNIYIMNIWWLNVYCWYNYGQTSGTRKRFKGLGHNTNNQVIQIIDNYG